MKKKIFTFVTLSIILSLLASLLVFLPACNTDVDEQSTQDEQTEQEQNNQAETYEVDALKIGILADIQLIPEAHLIDLDTEEYQAFLDSTGNFKMPELTEAIYKTSVDDLIEADVDVVFMIGDLTDNGAYVGMKIIAEGCAKLEAAGIPTFITNGLCDINHYRKNYVFTYVNGLSASRTITDEEFVTMFNDYGYGEAVSRDTNSLSYAADIPDTNYRLIVLDNASYFEDESTTSISRQEATKMPQGEMDWLESVLIDIKATGKEPLVITNIPLNKQPVSYFTDFVDDTHLTMQEGATLEALFAENGVKYIFNGHYHINAEYTATTENGNVTEIFTSSTCTYPCTIRYFNINSDYSYTTDAHKIEKLRSEYLTNTNVTAAVKTAVSTGFVAYSKVRVNEDLTQSLNANMYRKKGDKDMLIFFFEGLDMYPSEDQRTNEILEKLNADVLGWMVDYNDMPIYGMEVESVQSICAKYGVTLPNSRYAGHNVREFIFNLAYRILDGTFMVEEADIDSTIFTCIFQAGAMKMADLQLFDTIHEIIPAVVDCDMYKVVENFMQTGTLDLKVDNFLLAVVSLFFPYINNKFHIDLSSITSIDGLLETFDTIMPVISFGIPDIALFCNDEGKLEKENCYSLKEASITGKTFVEYIMFSVLVRTIIIL